MSNNKQSSVEKMFQEMLGIQQEGIKLTFDENLALLDKYKAIHQGEIEEAHNQGYGSGMIDEEINTRQYYNETFGNEQQ